MDNWMVDRNQGFIRFGIPERRIKLAAKLSAGDYLITYVSGGRSAFSDIRTVIDGKLEKLRFGGEYNGPYFAAVKTSPETILEEQDWLPVHEVKDNLALFGDGDWRQYMRVSLRQISSEDGLFLAEEIRRRHRNRKNIEELGKSKEQENIS